MLCWLEYSLIYNKNNAFLPLSVIFMKFFRKLLLPCDLEKQLNCLVLKELTPSVSFNNPVYGYELRVLEES